MRGAGGMAALFALAVCAWAEPRPDLVARVADGELKEARASWWGFDAEDATRALQAAIRSRVPKLIIDKMPSPWVVTPLEGVSDQTLFFEPGTEIRAKPGCFKGTGDILFSLKCVTNVTLSGYGAVLRMRRDDYDKPPYTHAEWRHTLAIRSCRNIKVYGLTLAESGGDGIYLGSVSDKWPNTDVHIKDVLCDKNYRQGISVISADGLLIENTVMRGTRGTAPQAGIDFEPNRNGERLSRCVMRDCVTENNEGDGYQFYLPNLVRDSAPLDIRLERCRSTGDRNGFDFTTGNSGPLAVTGSVTVADCVFERPRNQGIRITGKSVEGPSMRFERCQVLDVPADQRFTDVSLAARKKDRLPPGGIVFDRLTVRQSEARPWIALCNAGRTGGTVEALSGSVTIRAEGREETVRLDEAWRQKAFPPRFSVRIPEVKHDLKDAVMVDPEPGAMRKHSILKIRNNARYLFFAEKGRTVHFLARQFQVGKYPLSKKPMWVVRRDWSKTDWRCGLMPSRKPTDKPDGGVTWLEQLPLPGFELTEVSVVVPERGFYALEVDVGANGFALAAADVPVAIMLDEGGQDLVYTQGAFYLPVPKGTGKFAVAVSGADDVETVQVKLFDPDGTLVWHRDPVGDWERYEALHDEGLEGGLWKGELLRPSKGVLEDCRIELFGLPPYLFLTDSRYWSWGMGSGEGE